MKPKIYVMNWNGVIPDMRDEFDYVPSTEEAEAAILWQEVVSHGEDRARECRHRRIPYFVVQHGILGTMSCYRQHNKKPLCIGIFAWSDYFKKIYVADGVPDSSVHVIGCPLFSYKTDHYSDGKTVVFAPVHTVASDEENERNKQQAISIWNKILEIKKINPIVKLCANEHEPAAFQGMQCLTKRDSNSHVSEIYKLLKNVSCVVVQDDEAFAFIACSMNIPVIKIKNQYRASPACVETELDELPGYIHKLILSPFLLEKERKERISFFGGPANSKPKEKIIEVVMSYIRTPVGAGGIR